VATETIALLEKHKERPFFIAAGFYRPHCPFIAPKKYFDMYPLEKIKAPRFTPDQTAGLPVPALWTRPPNWGVDEDGVRKSIPAYYASITFLDAQAGRILDALDRLRLADNTIVVFVSDHGYHLGELGQWMKMSLFERSARNPLVIAGPGIARGVSSRTVELLDLYPTLGELAKLPLPSGLQGRSLTPLLKDPKAAWDRPALTQVTRGGATSNGTRGNAGCSCITSSTIPTSCATWPRIRSTRMSSPRCGSACGRSGGSDQRSEAISACASASSG